jgi:serine phosphatase RsbU (regulator of sigma subunit)
MATETDLAENLRILDRTARTLNRAVDVHSVLNDALVQLVRLMGLETGWIVLKDIAEPSTNGDSVYRLAAHHNLPPALGTGQAEAWAGNCECLRLCKRGQMTKAYNILRCSRLASVSGDRRGLTVHASTPLRAGGRILGVLNVAAPDGSSFHPLALNLLSSVGRQMGEALERAQRFEQLQEEHLVAIAVEEARRQQLENELALGQEMQLGLLPATCPVIPGWECAAFYQPARQLGGDFYDFIEMPSQPGRMGLVIADAVDKGVSAALLMALGRTSIRSSILGSRSPAHALMRANESLLHDIQSALFLTAFYGVLDTRSGSLVYANAGHNPPLWRRGVSGQFQELSARGAVLGVFDQLELEDRAIDVAPDDLLIFYTDGVTEAMNTARQQFGERRLREAVAAMPGATAQQVLEAVVDAVQAFAGDAAQSDDLTLLVVKRVAQSSGSRSIPASMAGRG